MGSRYVAVIVASVLALQTPNDLLPVGTVFPRSLMGSADSAEAALLWVFRTEDCLTCQAFDLYVRRAQRVHDAKFPFVAVHVGSAKEQTIAHAFFRDRRLQPMLITMSPRQYTRAFGRKPLAGFYLIRNGRVTWSPQLDPRQRSFAAFDSVIALAKPRLR